MSRRPGVALSAVGWGVLSAAAPLLIVFPFLAVAWEYMLRYEAWSANGLPARLLVLAIVLFLGGVAWRTNLFWVVSLGVFHIWFYLWERIPLLSLAVAVPYLVALAALFIWRRRNQRN